MKLMVKEEREKKQGQCTEIVTDIHSICTQVFTLRVCTQTSRGTITITF